MLLYPRDILQLQKIADPVQVLRFDPVAWNTFIVSLVEFHARSINWNLRYLGQLIKSCALTRQVTMNLECDVDSGFQFRALEHFRLERISTFAPRAQNAADNLVTYTDKSRNFALRARAAVDKRDLIL